MKNYRVSLHPISVMANNVEEAADIAKYELFKAEVDEVEEDFIEMSEYS